ncbi:MAG: MFS transporter [Chitinophagaceae bacterium]|nr:MAG: MFS transporter [Chitinophagaceae bacterium]
MADQPSPSQITNDPFAAVRIPEYRHLMIGRFCFVMSLRMMGTLVGWWVYQLTKNPLAIGLIGLSEVIPALSLALYSGHIIDTSEKRGLLLKCIFFYTCAAGILLVLSTPAVHDHVDNHSITYIIYAVIFGTGIIRSFGGPVFSAMIATIVPRQYLQNATTWNQASFLSASVTGHAIGGFLIAFFGNTGTLVIICGLLVTALVILFQVKPKPPASVMGEKKTWESVKEGLAFVFKTKELLGALSLDMFAVLFGGAVAMLPVYASDILKVGPMGFGWLNAATDIGSICVVVFLTLVPMRTAQGRKLLFAVAGFGLCIIVFALSDLFILSFVALLVSGMMDGISVVVRGTVMQLRTPDHMRGRVSSVGSMFINSSNELGQFESGVMSRLLGVRPSVIFGGCATILVVLVTWFKAPTLRKFEY